MNVQIEPTWKAHISAEFEKPYFSQLTDAVRQEYQTTTCYPPGKLIFNAFNLCPFEKVKVVIIGQDPYHEPRRIKSRQAQISPTSMAIVRSKITVNRKVTQSTIISLFGLLRIERNERHPLML